MEIFNVKNAVLRNDGKGNKVEINCSELIKDYNEHMGYVDVQNVRTVLGGMRGLATQKCGVLRGS